MTYDKNYTEELKNRFKSWAIQVVLFTRQFPFLADFKAIRNQMVRCAPSAAANYRTSCRAKSTPDMINKLKIVEEELDESMFWIEFVMELAPDLTLSSKTLHTEANELLSIIVASINTMKHKSDKYK
ncbi:MAG: four helix bundle protein [Saprospiraceae bacterium]